MRTPISYGALRPLLWATGMPPRSAWVQVDDDGLRVRMGWGFSADVPRASIVTARLHDGPRPLSIGVHGWRGRWLVNGSRSGLVVIAIEPAGRARVCGVEVSLTELTVSVDEPTALIDALS